MNQETDWIAVFSESNNLKSPERKAYYKELVAFSREWLLGMPIDAAQHFKRLFFEGYLPANRGVLGSWEPFLICQEGSDSDGYTFCTPLLAKIFLLPGSQSKICTE